MTGASKGVRSPLNEREDVKTKSLICGNCLDEMKLMADYSVDLIFTDPPYGLGSEVIIRPDGKPDYKRARDFMDKWDQPDGTFWEAWFKESFRILKHGGKIVMFGMDRQLLLDKYYAVLAGFEEHQSLYWYFLSSFPKSTSLSKNIDKYSGEEREVVGGYLHAGTRSSGIMGKDLGTVLHEITAPAHPLAKKYNGYRYSISPLKQVVETILVFQKPCKTGSPLHDVLALETGDSTVTCAALDIDGGRVPTAEVKDKTSVYRTHSTFSSSELGQPRIVGGGTDSPLGRYPAQAFVQCICDEVISGEAKEPYSYKGKEYAVEGFLPDNKPEAPSNYNDSKSRIHTNPECPCAILDRQSGECKSSGIFNAVDHGNAHISATPFSKWGVPASMYDDTGGSSKILHQCRYEAEDYDVFNYCPKVSKAERNGSMHPTLKPLSLATKILSLFRLPMPSSQVVLDPFSGTGTIGVACLRLNIGYIGIEINTEYTEFANSRIEAEELKIATQPKQSTIFEAL